VTNLILTGEVYVLLFNLLYLSQFEQIKSLDLILNTARVDLNEL